jgi:hypothetical protein
MNVFKRTSRKPSKKTQNVSAALGALGGASAILLAVFA